MTTETKILTQERDVARQANAKLREVLEPIVQMLKIGYNTGLIQLEINGAVAFRPIDPVMRDTLSTLFTHLFNADAILQSTLTETAQDAQII